jgi:hypothetical protein
MCMPQQQQQTHPGCRGLWSNMAPLTDSPPGKSLPVALTSLCVNRHQQHGIFIWCNWHKRGWAATHCSPQPSAAARSNSSAPTTPPLICSAAAATHLQSSTSTTKLPYNAWLGGCKCKLGWALSIPTQTSCSCWTVHSEWHDAAAAQPKWVRMGRLFAMSSITQAAVGRACAHITGNAWAPTCAHSSQPLKLRRQVPAS